MCQPHMAAEAAEAWPASRTEAQALAGCCCRDLGHHGQGRLGEKTKFYKLSVL